MLPLIGALVGAGASIFGANKAASTAKKAAAQQAAGIQQGITDSQGYYDAGQNFLQPYVQQGQQYGTLMNNIIGINGPGAQTDALGMYESSPSAALLKNVKDETFRRGMNTWSAAGGGNSGRAIEDVTRRMSDVTLNDYYQWQGLGKDLYGTGANAAGSAANLAAGRGRDILGARTGQGTATASGTAAGGLYGAAGMASAGNYLANFMGKKPTDFSNTFSTGAAAPYNSWFNPSGYSSVLPGGVGAVPY